MGDAERLGRRLLERAGVTVGGSAPHDIRVHDSRLWERVLRDRELGLGEAYQDGWWDAPRVDAFLAKVLEANLDDELKPNLETIGLVAKAVLTNRQSVRRARRNARAHYDIFNDLYERMLDRRMVYSCAYWRDADNLDDAQTDKLELICRKLELEPGMRVLDIGCGWGGFAEYAARAHGARVTGVSPAMQQVTRARERCAGLDVDIRLADYRELDGRYDRIVSVGMMEHVGPKNLGTFFGRCADLLEGDGLMLHHTIGSVVSQKTTDPWFDRYIFPGGVLPSITQIGRAAERRWAIEDVHNFGGYYDRTLLAWYDKVEASWHELPAYDERFRRTWRYYLLASAASFRVRNLQLYQIVFRRAGRRAPVYEAPRAVAPARPRVTIDLVGAPAPTPAPAS